MNALVIASTASMIDQFNMPNIRLLIELGYTVYVACNFKDGNTCSDKQIENLKIILKSINVEYIHIDFDRNVYNFVQNNKAYRQIKKIIHEHHFNIIHCHTPIGSVLTRLAARKYRKQGTKVIYTAHGFHFFKGAPLKNWLLYYPVEWLCSFFTDELITINKEDYARAQKHMHAKHITYIPGVGVDTKKFAPNLLPMEEKVLKRAELGVKDGEKMLLSVGELISRKNHESVIRALAKLNDPKIKYFICGNGGLKDELENLSKELKLSDNITFLGYRTDISALCECADLFVFPSLQEGLSVALMEAIASKTPVICSNIRGNTDLIKGHALFDAKNILEISERIEEYLHKDNSEETERNFSTLKKFDLENVSEEMKALYLEKRVMIKKY